MATKLDAGYEAVAAGRKVTASEASRRAIARYVRDHPGVVSATCKPGGHRDGGWVKFYAAGVGGRELTPWMPLDRGVPFLWGLEAGLDLAAAGVPPSSAPKGGAAWPK